MAGTPKQQLPSHLILFCSSNTAKVPPYRTFRASFSYCLFAFSPLYSPIPFFCCCWLTRDPTFVMVKNWQILYLLIKWHILPSLHFRCVERSIPMHTAFPARMDLGKNQLKNLHNLNSMYEVICILSFDLGLWHPSTPLVIMANIYTFFFCKK